MLKKSVAGYKDMDATGFYRKHREFMNAFLEKAHMIQIPDSEINMQIAQKKLKSGL